MNTDLVKPMMPPLILHTSDVVRLTDDELFGLCAANRDLRIERDSDGNLILRAPAGGETSARNLILGADLVNWNRKTRLGIAFDSNGGFLLPNGAMRAPDASWIPIERWNGLSAEQRKKFLPLCPDFVVELRSPSDRLADVQKKMQEWMDNGCRLGWLIDPEEEKAYVYRETGEPSMVESYDETLSGEDVLPGFVLELKEIR
jgi:Uma2 family endonuclease